MIGYGTAVDVAPLVEVAPRVDVSGACYPENETIHARPLVPRPSGTDMSGPLRVMLIEDNPSDAFLVREMLRDAWADRFELRHVSRMADVDRDVAVGWAQCILLDLTLPDAEGLDGFNELHLIAPDAPVVVLSGREDEAIALEAVRRGAQDYLTKSRVDGYALGRAITHARERKAFEVQLVHLALHDPLTGLPNRTLFKDRLEVALSRRSRSEISGAVLFLDLNRFKTLNDSFGHNAGDELIVAIARRLALVLRPGDTVARFGGDEFTILLEEVADEHEAMFVAARLAKAVAAPVTLGVGEVYVTASIGIALIRPDSDTESLLRNADAAMYCAKERAGLLPYELFDESLVTRAIGRLRTENELHRAIERHDFRVVYQPVISISTGAISGAEALVRWHHPERGVVFPDEFISMAEETGLIVAISEQVFDQACRSGAGWPGDELTGPLKLAINLSVRHLREPRLAVDIFELIERSGLDPRRVCLEITESVLMDGVAVSIDALHRLREIGVQLAIDDFGTGYSSLGYLKRLPVDIIKLDRCMVEGLGVNRRDTAMVDAIVTLAHALDMTIVAEGVETAAQFAALRDLGCDHAQGYWLSKPKSEADFERFVGDYADHIWRETA